MDAPIPEIRKIIASDMLHRVFRNAHQAEMLDEAFMVRADERDSGLSVNYNCTADEARTSGELNPTYGAASLTAQCVFALELRVEPDEPQHANIVGVPYKEDDRRKAEWLAGKLAECVVATIKGKWVKPKDKIPNPRSV